MTWVLLVIVIGVNNNPAMTSVPGFASERECMEAGAMVQRRLERGLVNSVGFQCLRQGKAG